MKALFLIVVAIASFITSVFSQNNFFADEIIDKHVKARGGQEVWDKVESIKFTGTYTGFSIPNKFTTIQKQPNLYRSDFGLGKFNVTLAYNGNIGWTIDPWFDIAFARELGKSELNVVQQKAEICSPFLNYKEKGYKVEYLGEENLEGIRTHKLKLIRTKEQTEIWYLNAETFLEVKQESIWDDFGYATPQETYFDDFRKVNDLMFPFYIERSYIIRNRIIEIDQIIINEFIDMSIFELPLSNEMKKLKQYEGEWNVVVNALNRRGWYKADSVTCEIVLDHNLLKGSLSYTTYFKQSKHFSWSYHSDNNEYRMSLFDGFYSSMELYHGNFNNDTLSFEKIISTDSIGKFKGSSKFSVSSVNKNSFVVELATSNGENKWTTNEKLQFYRLEEKNK